MRVCVMIQKGKMRHRGENKRERAKDRESLSKENPREKDTE
jgi:hypothetical protein